MIKRLENSTENVHAIHNLEKLCFFDHAWSVAAIQGEFANTFSIFFAYIVNDKVAGYVCVREVCDEFQIANIAVDPSLHRQGIGQALLEHLVLQAKKTGKQQLVLEVSTQNFAAIALYKKCNFEVVGLRKNFYSDSRYPSRDAMTLVCRPNVQIKPPCK